MNSMFTQIARYVSRAMDVSGAAHAESGLASDNVAQALMAKAQAGAGRDPHEAEELRSAASAYLSVVR
jgi:hypothetical protein